jgi:UbiD family decarboxylase
MKDLKEFLNLLRKEGDLKEINCEVNPHLETAEIHRRVIQNSGPALLFKNVRGSPFPLATNLFGTEKRIELAFGKRPEKFIREIASLPETLIPPSIKKLWSYKSTLLDLMKVGTKKRTGGPVKETTQVPPRLSSLPLLTTWEEDGGPFITLPLVYTEHPESGMHNLGMYRMQRYSDSELGLHCQIGKGGGYHLAEAKALNRNLPVNVFIGGPPALILSAVAPLPENIPELMLASLVAGHKINLAKNPSGQLPLMANAEFTLVGEVNPNEMKPEGPFGDHYGYYSLKHDYPVFRCKALYHKKDAVFCATVVGKPKQEDFFIGDYLQKLLSPLFPLVMPAVKDLWSYGETGYHSLACAVVKQRYKREAMASAFRILGEGQLSLTKFLLVSDKEIDIRNFKIVLPHILERCDFRTDLYVFSNLSMDTLDYTGPSVNEGSKGVMLGVGDPIRKLPFDFKGMQPPGIKNIEVFCAGCLVVDGIPYAKDAGISELILENKEFKDWPLIILVDDAKKACRDTMSFLWTTFTRFEPGADIHAAAKEIKRNHISYAGPILIDARMKPGYPAELECDENTKKLVDRRWGEYGLS